MQRLLDAEISGTEKSGVVISTGKKDKNLVVI